MAVVATAIGLATLAMVCSGTPMTKAVGTAVVDIAVTSHAEARFLNALPGIDIWSFDGQAISGRNVTATATPSAHARIQAARFAHTVVAADVTDHTSRMERPSRQYGRDARGRDGTADVPRPPGGDRWFTTWHSYAEIQAKLRELVRTHPDTARLVPNLGVTAEGRPIDGICIHPRTGGGGRGGRGVTAERAAVIMAGAHAREWISEAVAMWFVGTALLDTDGGGDAFPNTDVYVVPCYNPDGYEYSRTNERYWRKNRRRNADGSYGVDINRNWDVDWCRRGGSTRPSSSIYCGPEAFSEPEALAMSMLIKQTKPDAVIDLHSYGSMILRPYGYTRSVAPDDAATAALAQAMRNVMRSVHPSTVYTTQRAVDLYQSSGGADDWSKAAAGVRTVFTIELAGADFVVPTQSISWQGAEVYPALKLAVLS